MAVVDDGLHHLVEEIHIVTRKPRPESSSL